MAGCRIFPVVTRGAEFFSKLCGRLRWVSNCSEVSGSHLGLWGCGFSSHFLKREGAQKSRMKGFLISVELTGSLETEDTNVGPLMASHVNNSIVLLLVENSRCGLLLSALN